MRVAILYQSKSGNTRELAEEVYDCLDEYDREIIDIDEENEVPDADFYFVGFGIHNNNCSMDVADALEKLDGKSYALFMCCGLMPTDNYKDKILDSIDVWLPDNGELVDTFLCQGKMERYELDVMVGKMPWVEEQLKGMYEMGLSHPDESDFANVREFVSRIMDKISL